MLPTLSGKSTIAAIALALMLSACASDRARTTGVSRTGNSLSQMTVPQLQRAIDSYGRQYERRPKNKKAGLNYANALRIAGRNEQAVAVMQQMVITHPKDNDILGAYGKALASNGNLTKALEVISRAQRDDRPDWRLLSAQGTVLDQLDRPSEARTYYHKALQIAPNEQSILSNLGMSYLLTNELQTSERYLREAMNQPRVDSRVRQNLALVVGLQGRFEEAEKIASADLSPADAQANVEYLRQMLSQQNAWNLLKQEDKAAQ